MFGGVTVCARACVFLELILSVLFCVKHWKKIYHISIQFIDVNRNKNVMRVKVLDRTGLGSSEHRCAQNCREWTAVECTVYAYSTISRYGSKDHLPSVRLVADL